MPGSRWLVWMHRPCLRVMAVRLLLFFLSLLYAQTLTGTITLTGYWLGDGQGAPETGRRVILGGGSVS